ncbi:hypothetical protein FOC1_g10000682 [Fusarium oxysporum f. sp. cubense race 1]|uniref:Xylanolytic transcriptional activator regulatory domain-containing protein n=1 Tax=Fusarium oxysporum f. sp. cubense (strain race 1) TaxID=1229664 RepID=N4UBZ6_FUSC1|nr:hypothetical protein FOC1_g10000682 [Fusarium oxysporum f. sp. cubense race 1]
MPSVEHHESSIDFGTQASAPNTSHGSTPNDIPHFGMATDILDHLIDVYRVKLHIQPLPLFNIGTLREVLANAQPYLVWSFVALTLPLSSPEYPGHPDPETVARDTQSAESTVMRMATDGIPRLDVVQSLCLLALKDVMENMLNRAWMTIGTASRLEALRQARRRHAGCRIPDQDASSRCYWSVFILERIAPEYLSSYPTPPLNFHNGHDLDQEDSRAPSKYVGINAHYIRTLMIWTKVVSYLHEIRSGRRETPWLSNSTYAKLNVEILDFDTELYPAHRLKNQGLSGRLHPELSKKQEYWYPWFMVQVASHASLALILEILQSLQATAGCQLWGIEPRNTTITFHSSKLWQLLDSNLADEFYASTCEGGDVMVDNRDLDIMLHVVTRYVDPLEDRDMQQALDITSSKLPTAGALDNLPEKDCLSLFLPEDFEWLQAF